MGFSAFWFSHHCHLNHDEFRKCFWRFTRPLKQIASVYDPLGLFCPVTLRGKLFLQELWNKKLSLDDKLSSKYKENWNKIREDLKNLPSCRFSRYIGLTQENQDKTTYRLVGFCDVSKHAYAGVVYLYQRTGKHAKFILFFFQNWD